MKTRLISVMNRPHLSTKLGSLVRLHTQHCSNCCFPTSALTSRQLSILVKCKHYHVTLCLRPPVASDRTRSRSQLSHRALTALHGAPDSERGSSSSGSPCSRQMSLGTDGSVALNAYFGYFFLPH